MTGATGATGLTGATGATGPAHLIVGGGTGGLALDKNSVQYVPMFDSQIDATEANVVQSMPVAGTMTNLFIRLAVAPGGPKSYTFTVRKNGTDTSLTTTISGAATTGSNVVNSVSYNSGDTISVKSSPASSPSVGSMKWTATIAP